MENAYFMFIIVFIAWPHIFIALTYYPFPSRPPQITPFSEFSQGSMPRNTRCYNINICLHNKTKTLKKKHCHSIQTIQQNASF